MRTFYLVIFILVALLHTTFAQQQPATQAAPRPVEKKGILYNSSLAFGGQLYTNGWSAHMEWARINTLHRRNFYQIEIGQLRHWKETRQPSIYDNRGISYSALNPPKPFVFGKRNNFYQVNLSRGQERMIGQRAAKSGVEVSVKYMAGFSLGIVKPYYLQYFVPTDNSGESTFTEDKYNDASRPYFLNRSAIYGSAGFSKGVTESSVIPGAHIKAGLKFDWAFFDEYIKALEVGGVVDIYPRRVPIMILDKNPRVFPNLYLGIQLGKKKA
jgi:hypothetical protein